MSLLKRCSIGFSQVGNPPVETFYVPKSRSSDGFFRTDSFPARLRFGLSKPSSFPLDEKSNSDTARCLDCHSQVTDTNDVSIHADCLEKDTTAAQKHAEKVKMATKSRVEGLRQFFGIASPTVVALQNSEKAEYEAWHAYSRQEQNMRQRYQEIADEPSDVEVMLRGWRVEHAPPRLSETVRDLINKEIATQRSYICSSGGSDLPALSQDIIWNALTHVLTPPSWAKCQICELCMTPVSAAPCTMYRLSCGHYYHVHCFEGDYERWLGSSCPTVAKGAARECIRCKGLKDLIRGLPRAELDARIRRVGDTFLHRRSSIVIGKRSVG